MREDHTGGKCSWAGHARGVQLFPWRSEGCVVEGGTWEESVDRAGFSDPADGAARSEAWLPHQRTSVSGRLNGCLNTQRCVKEGQLTPGGQEGASLYSRAVNWQHQNLDVFWSFLQILLLCINIYASAGCECTFSSWLHTVNTLFFITACIFSF